MVGPTGEGFVSGSYDRTVRLWERDSGGRSRDVYHTKRMQRVFSTCYTPTADFVLSGSDDGNVRIWKTDASAKLGPIDTRERAAMEYRRKLREKWGGEKGVRRIEQCVSVPYTFCACRANRRSSYADNAESRRPSRMQRNSNVRCSVPGSKRRRTGGDIQGKASTSPRRRERVSDGLSEGD